ncbi:DNAse I-like superfamily protein, partial [Striga hermonthica]
YWQQKSKIKWLKEGDGNTKFFHAYAQQRRRMNAIIRLVSARGQEFCTQKEMEEHTTEFYSVSFHLKKHWG